MQLVVEAFHCLAETSTTKFFQNFISVSKMVFDYNLVITTFIIIATVGLYSVWSFNFPWAAITKEIHLIVRLNFYSFIISQLAWVLHQGLTTVHRERVNLANLTIWLLRIRIWFCFQKLLVIIDFFWLPLNFISDSE